MRVDAVDVLDGGTRLHSSLHLTSLRMGCAKILSLGAERGMTRRGSA